MTSLALAASGGVAPLEGALGPALPVLAQVSGQFPYFGHIGYVTVPGRLEERYRAVPAGCPPHGWAARPESADPHGWAWLLHGGGQQRHVLGLVVPAVVVHGPAGPEASQQLQPLVQAFGEQTRVRGVAETAVLVLDRTAQTRGEGHPVAAEVVQGGDLAGELLRTVTGDRRQQGAQPNA